MASKILLIVACFTAIKELNGAAVNPNTCSFRVEQLQSQIGVEASQCRYEVNSATTAIKTEISLAISNINTQLAVLQNKANAVLSPNAQLCKKKLQLDLTQVNTQATTLCFPKAEINALNIKVNQLNRLKGDASLICDTCNQLYPLPTEIEELNNCIDARIGAIENQAVEIQTQISSDASALEGKSGQCVQDTESTQLKIINDASANFDACIGAP